MRLFAVTAALLLAALSLCAQEITVELVLESTEVYVGEQFTAQIRVEGSSSPREPSLAALTDFDVRSFGGQPNNTEFVSITNGRVSRSSSLGFIFTYQLSARRAGTLLIPRIEVKVGDRILSTEPARVVAVKPTEADGFRLAVELPSTRAYVGQGMLLTVTWFISEPVRNVYFNVPFLANDAFRFTVPQVETSPGGRYSTAMVNEGETVVELGESTLEGTQYTTVRFSRVLTPLRPGTYEVPQASAQFEARVGRQRQRSLIDSFFDTSGGDYRPFAVSSRATTLRVLPLPTQGAPGGFAGHVGRYLLDASASPRQATVGDPISLTLTISGPPNVADAPPPDLAGQRVARDFALQSGGPQAAPAAAATRTPQMSYVYTIRATRAGITEIPPIELPYFDPQTSRYEVARSAPIPVNIVNARVVTSRDAEGAAAPAEEPVAAPEDAAEQGVAQNYEKADALWPQYRALAGLVRRPLVLVLLILSLLSVAVSAALTTGRRLFVAWRQGGREAYRRLEREMAQHAGPAAGSDPAASLGAILSSVNGYFARRLKLPPGAGTFGDVSGALARRGVPAQAIAELADVYRICEAGRYAGYSLDPQTVREVSRRASLACSAVEDHLESQARRPRSPAGTTGAAGAVLIAALLAGASAPGLDAQSRAQALALWEQANATFRSANEAAPKNARSARELYARAAEQYEHLVGQGGRQNAKLYYNLGNAYYRLGDIGRAILAFRRAELLDPADADLRHNLTQARLDREDRIEATTAAPLTRVLFFWHFDFSPGTRVLLFALSFAGAAGVVSAWFFLRRRVLLRVAAALAVPAVLFLGSLVVEQVRLARRPEGVILAPEVTARRGDGDIYQPAFQRPLHAGTEFRLLENRQSWYRIRIGDGRSCWIPARSAELLVDPTPDGPL